MVENSYLGSSDEVSNRSGNSTDITRMDFIIKIFPLFHLVPPQVSKLVERVEVAFVERFANGNHRKGLRILRPKTKRKKHRITFSSGKMF